MDFENDVMPVDEGQENVADSPIDETEETTTETDEAAEGQETADEEGAPDQEEQAEPAKQPPQKKPTQSKEEDSKYAAARREEAARRAQVEAELSAERARNDAFAKRYGYPDFAAMERAEQTRQYTEQGIPEALANKIVELEQEQARTRAEREQMERDRADQAQYTALMERYPETRQMEHLPDRVYELMREGETPVNAYRAYKIEQLELENTALKQNDATKRKAIGSVKGAAPLNGKSDPFLDGWNSR